MQVTHLGHACLLIEQHDSRVLVDPGTLAGDLTSLRGVSAIALTHDHRDHRDSVLLERVLRQNPGASLLDQSTLFPPDAPVGMRTSVHVGEITLDVHAVRHAPVFGDEPDMVNLSLTVPRMLHYPGDSFDPPEQPVYALAVPIGGPWLKLAEVVEYARLVSPRVVLPVHEGQLADPNHSIAILRSLLPDGIDLVPDAHGRPITVPNP